MRNSSRIQKAIALFIGLTPALAACSSSGTDNVGGAFSFKDAAEISIEGKWESSDFKFITTEGPAAAKQTWTIQKPNDRLFKVRRFVEHEAPQELVQGDEDKTTHEHDFLGVIEPDGSILMVEVGDETIWRAWFIDDNTLKYVSNEPDEMVGHGTAKRAE